MTPADLEQVLEPHVGGLVEPEVMSPNPEIVDKTTYDWSIVTDGKVSKIIAFPEIQSFVIFNEKVENAS